RRGGGLGRLGTEWGGADPPIPEAASELLREPFERSGRCFQADVRAWRGAFDGSPFEPPREERIRDGTTRSAEELATLFCSTSSIASLEPAERDELRRRLLDLLSGGYRLPVEVAPVWTRRR